MNIRKILIIGTILCFSGVVIGEAFADNGTSPYSLIPGLLGFLTFPAAGIYYATTGFVKKFARSLSGEKTEIDYTKIGKTTILGVLVGVASFVYVTIDGSVIQVLTLQEFLGQVAINLTVVLTVDRLVLGGYAKPKTGQLK